MVAQPAPPLCLPPTAPSSQHWQACALTSTARSRSSLARQSRAAALCLLFSSLAQSASASCFSFVLHRRSRASLSLSLRAPASLSSARLYLRQKMADLSVSERLEVSPPAKRARLSGRSETRFGPFLELDEKRIATTLTEDFPATYGKPPLCNCLLRSCTLR